MYHIYLAANTNNLQLRPVSLLCSNHEQNRSGSKIKALTESTQLLLNGYYRMYKIEYIATDIVNIIAAYCNIY